MENFFAAVLGTLLLIWLSYVGLIAFASTPGCYREARAGIAGFAECLDGLEASGSTDLAAALTLATKKIARCPGNKVFCVVTDGVPDDADAALAAAGEAVRHGIEIMAIGTDDADRTFLDRLVTRRELADKVERRQLRQGIASMAGLLPGGDRR
jgi:Mg-chelatase subunit ChlD